MGRGKDRGILSDLMDISDAVPAVGLVLALGLAALGGYCWWINPKLIYGLGPVWAILAWLLAALVGGAAAGGHLRRRLHQRSRARRLGQVRTLDDLKALSPAEFEQVVADHYRREGYRVTETGGPGDGGVDLLLRPPPAAAAAGTPEHLVQCKRYRARQVGVPEVRDFYGAMAAHATRGEGILITCGGFTPDAINFAAGKPIRLIPGPELASMLASANGLRPAVRSYTTPPGPTSTPAHVPAAPAVPPTDVPRCPACRTPMVRRTASRGNRAGKPFWGCGSYPRCQMTIDII